MKAIVLSCDKYHPISEHMIRSYQDVWPDNPFVFRVPYQTHPTSMKERLGGRVELIETPVDIKHTLLGLIADLADEEWIYWCIDDKYPIDLNIDVCRNLHGYVNALTDPSVQGVLFCRCRKLLQMENLRAGTEVMACGEIPLIERKNYYQFWIHQFMRVGVLRELFSGFPDRHFNAKEMDSFTGQEESHGIKEFQDHQKMYVTAHNYARFGESAWYGRLTKNCHESMLRKGLMPPASWQVEDVEDYMGEVDPRHIPTAKQFQGDKVTGTAKRKLL